jgi:hypothetical protein
MKQQDHNNLLKPDVFDILAATWVFACNDENPIITYEGLRRRLNLEPSFDICGLVRKRTDLFRLGIPKSRLSRWKQEMLQGKHLPAWIREISDETKRMDTINSLSSCDGFRSQFRANDGAEKSPLEVLKWGLEHIDRLRKVHYEARENSAKSWQMWLVFAVGVMNIIATISVAMMKGDNHDTTKGVAQNEAARVNQPSANPAPPVNPPPP